jgi:serine/threonine-protein kinase ULK/ATG1
MASKKLFGTQTHRHRPSREYATPPSPRRPQLLRVEDGAQRDPLEDELLASLESLAQKTDVLTNWADEMYEAVKAIPQSAFHYLIPCCCKLIGSIRAIA